MSDTSGLRCSTCGAAPEKDVPATAGGSHFKRLQHGAGIPGRQSGLKLRTCGKWRAREPGEEG